MGLVALPHVGSSRTRDRTRVPCIGRWILNHCTTREVLIVILYIFSWEIFSASLQVILINSVSVNSRSIGVPMGGSELRVSSPLPTPSS